LKSVFDNDNEPSPRENKLLATIILLIVVLSVATLWVRYDQMQFDPLPDMASYNSAAERKAAFYDYLAPIVELHNQRILMERKRLLRIEQAAYRGESTWWDRRWLKTVATRYRLNPEETNTLDLIAELKKRIDILPLPLVIVQAAKESGWGRSRFAVEGNALFGQWCYDQGCGMVPENRPAGARHEVRRFDSVSAAVDAYMHNLHTDRRYQRLRDLRQQQRLAGDEPDALTLADGLRYYSERRDDYVTEVKAMIRQYQTSQPAAPGAS